MRQTERLQTAKIFKEIEYATLTGQNTEEFYNQLQPTEVPEVRLYTKCSINVKDFPFDKQCCEVSFFRL